MTTRALFIYLYVVWINQSDVILRMTTPSQSKSFVWLTQIRLLKPVMFNRKTHIHDSHGLIGLVLMAFST